MHKIWNYVNSEKMKTICQTSLRHAERQCILIGHSFHFLFLNPYPTNAPDPFKSASYERTKWVRCGHLNAPHSHV